MLPESWQKATEAWLNVTAVKIVKNVDILRDIESCTYRICCWSRWEGKRGKSKDDSTVFGLCSWKHGIAIY